MGLYFLIRFIPKFEYIKNRILSFFDSETGTHNAQSEKAIDSITSGGYFGKGIGEGTLKNRVPEAHTDYIISVISEEFGVIAIILILLLFLIFIYSVFKKVYFENEDRTKLVLVGCISLILLQAIIHIGVNIKIISNNRNDTSFFISYGGSSIISISILSGIILNLTKERINLDEKNILITTGGSGGHVVPATILYDHLSKETNVLITIDKRGLKYLDKTIYKFEIINTPKLNNIFFLPFNVIIILFLIFKIIFSIKK